MDLSRRHQQNPRRRPAAAHPHRRRGRRTTPADFDVIAVDWAGTLTGPRHRPDAALVKKVLDTGFGIAVPTSFTDLYHHRFWNYYEKSLADSLELLLTDVAAQTGVKLPDLDRLIPALWDECGDHDIDHQAADAIHHLHHTHGTPVWLASNTCRPVARRQDTLIQAGLGFIQPLCSSDIGVAKPDPDFYRELTRRAGVSANRIMFIGDHLVPDVLGPAKAGMRTVWVHGATAHEEETHPVPESTIRVRHLTGLSALLEGAGAGR